MSDISNKTLLILLILIIVLSLASTFISLNKFGKFTGLQLANVTQQTGSTQVQILGAAQFLLYNYTLNWGTGQVNGTYTAGFDYCNLTTNGSIISEGNNFTASGYGGGKSGACEGFATLIPWSFILENTGNTNFTNITVNATNGDAGFKTTYTANAKFLYRVAEEGNSCTGTLGANTSYTLMPNSDKIICDTFLAGPSSSDGLLFQMRFSLPEDSYPASFNDGLTFTGTV